MHYSYDSHGWYAGEVPPGAKRATPSAPPTTSTTTTPGEERANWTGRAWVVRAYAAPSTPPPPPPPSPPSEVSMAQARIALSRAGLLTSVTAAIDQLPDDQKPEAQLWWEYSSTVQRSHPLVIALASGLGLSSAELDTLFTAAAAIEGS